MPLLCLCNIWLLAVKSKRFRCPSLEFNVLVKYWIYALRKSALLDGKKLNSWSCECTAELRVPQCTSRTSLASCLQFKTDQVGCTNLESEGTWSILQRHGSALRAEAHAVTLFCSQVRVASSMPRAFSVLLCLYSALMCCSVLLNRW